MLLVALAVATRCTREVDVPRIAGRLLDERTGKPIEGAALYVGFTGTNALNAGGHGSAATGVIGEQIAITDANGRFEFRPYSFRTSWFVRLKRSGSPSIHIVHREYGSDIEFLSEDRTNWEQLALQTGPSPLDLEEIKSGSCESPCGGLGHVTYPQASAFGTQSAHESLADAAIRRARREPAVGTYLRHDLGLARGADERLAVQFGLDAGVDDDLVTDASQSAAIETRLNRSLSWYDPQESGATFRPFAPDAVRVFFDHGCRTAPDFDSCYAALERAPIGKLIQIGTYAEDNPNPRSQHHFHDPERSHGISGHGLDNSSALSDSLAGTLALEIATIARGGSWRRAFAAWLTYPGRPQTGGLGNFDLRGRSAIDRALNLSGFAGLASDEYPENRFALPDAERYLYRSLASAAEDDRENYLALHFIALGHVLHLLQDQASSPHTRNDFIRDHFLADKLPGESSLETNGDDPRTVLDVIREIDQGELLRSLPFSYLASQGLATAFNVSAQVAVDALGADVADFWDRGDFDDPEEDPSVAGLAERVHNRFFSEGSISNSVVENGYALPRVPSCELGDSDGAGPAEVRTVSLPERSVETGETIGSTHGHFVSSPLVPHLARCRYHAERESAMGTPSAHPWSMTVRDSSVQRDYLELLFPLAIDYGAKFLQHYLAPRVEVVPTGPGEFTLRNLTALPFTADADTLEIAYTAMDASDPEGQRVRAPVDCDASELVLPPRLGAGPAPLGDFTCTLPGTLSPAALDALDYWVIVRGQLGRRGEVGTASEYDTSIGPKDFVVAFDHVQPHLLIHGAVANETFVDADPHFPLDVFAIPLDLTHEAGASDVPPTRTNRTAELRAELGGANLDIALPDGVGAGSCHAALGRGRERHLLLRRRLACTKPA